MKKLFLLIGLLLSVTAFAQTTWIVDHNFNAPTGNHVFGTIQEAVTAASNGDIIQIQPSATAYGSASVDKSLTIIGIGFNLTKEIPYQSTIGTITLTRNAASAENASGSTITGLTISEIRLGVQNGAAYTLSDVTINNCRITTLSGVSGGVPINNLLVHSNDITSSVRIYNLISGDSWFRNNVIRANYLDFRSSSPSTITITNNILYCYIYITSATTSIPILNNNFVGASAASYAFGLINEKLISNNIFYGRTPAANNAGTDSPSLTNSIFNNNLSISTGNDVLPPAGTSNSGSNNLVTVSPSFTNVPVNGTWSSSYDFTLLTGPPPSAAIDAGSDGTDIGITGGFYPWVEPNLVLKTTAGPTIEILNTGTIINPGDSLAVRVKVKSN